MIFPGHIAASLLCHRYAHVSLPVAMAAGLAPDVVDKIAYYGLHIVPSSRLPMHTLWGWLASTLLLVLLGLALRRTFAWGSAWFLSYGVHLLCDSGLVGDDLPLLYPLVEYDLTSAAFPLAYLFDLTTWPWPKLIAEALLVGITLTLEWRRGTFAPRARRPLAGLPLGGGER